MRPLSKEPAASFLVGVNLPWSARRVETAEGVTSRTRAGWDFGPGPPGWRSPEKAPRPRSWASVRRDLAALRALGVRDVRFFVLLNGVNYPVGEPLERYGEVRARFGELRFERRLGSPPPALPPAFVQDFEGLLLACRAAGVRLWPSLLSFELFRPLEVRADGVTLSGRGAFVFGRLGRDAAIEAFLDATLAPLLAAARRIPDAVGAFEVMNEPKWVVESERFRLLNWSRCASAPLHGLSWSRRASAPLHRPRVRPRAMSRFLLLGVRRIVEAGFVATVGFFDPDPPWLAASTRRELVRLGASGAYVHQLHHYPGRHHARRLRPHATLPIRPCIVGEFASAQGTPFVSEHMHWEGPGLREGDRERYLEARLSFIERLGYGGAFVWGYHSSDGASEWGEGQARQLGAFTRSRDEAGGVG
jgi:hypothetical protein